MALRSGLAALSRGLAKVGRLFSAGSGNRRDKLHSAIENTKLRKASKMEKEEMRTRFRIGDATNDKSWPVIPPPEQVTSPEHYMREILVASPTKRRFFRKNPNGTRNGRHSEALGSHPIKQTNVPILHSSLALEEGNEALISCGGKQPSLQRKNSFSQSGDGRLGREEEEADRRSTLRNSSASTIWNLESSEQGSGSNWNQPSVREKTSFSQSGDESLGRDVEEADRWSTLRNSSTSTIWDSDSSDQDSSSEQEPYPWSYEDSHRGPDMIEPRVTEMTVRIKPRSIRFPYGTTGLRRVKLEMIKRELSTWRRQCDKLRGQNSDLQHVVNGIRWAAEDWLGMGPNDQVTGAQAVWLVDEMKDRVAFYEQCCPELRAAFDRFHEEEEVVAQAKLKHPVRVKRKNNKRTNKSGVSSEAEPRTNPSELILGTGPGIINSGDISRGHF
ncbi:hypothetical protein EDB81DRAFT_778719 [Dactylonectria macrodidyma]|uniref:Uncharacterized protein n=1 Tax=Dactylonectria macrodidyma TaxID=307937 RepID=A0A9P9FRZ7_9HYPO|nr:hypothetical protein EDB81DRAFT_778719 [Dactylonectria macrodidyma]